MGENDNGRLDEAVPDMPETEEAAYINEYVPAESDYKEFYRQEMSRIKVCLVILGANFFVLLLTKLVPGKADGDWFGTALIGSLTVLILFLYIWMPGYSARALMRRITEGRDKEALSTMRFTDGRIILSDAASGATLEYRYEDIKNCRETDNLYLLKTKANQVLLLRKDAFIRGDAASFKNYIAGKCPSARLRW